MPVAPPLIRWTTPSAVLRSFSFPDYATDYSAQVVSSFVQSKSAGNVISHYPRGAYDEVNVEYVGAFDQAFHDEVVAWWSHAASGGIFDFFLEGDMTDTAPLIQRVASFPVTVVVSHVGAPFIVGRELTIAPVIASGDTAKRDSFTAGTIVTGFPTYGINTWVIQVLGNSSGVLGHLAGEQVRSKYGFPACVVLQHEFPLRVEPGLIMRFSLRLRSFASIVVP